MVKLVNTKGENLFPIENVKLNEYTWYTRIGNIVVITYNRTYSIITDGISETVATLPFKCYTSRVTIPMVVGPTYVANSALSVSDDKVTLFRGTYANAVTILGSVVAIIKN